MPIFDLVFRANDPPGLKGRLCRRVSVRAPLRGNAGRSIPMIGEGSVGVEFEDGERLTVRRADVILAASRLGRMTINRVGRKDQRVRRTMTKGTT